MSTNKSIFRTKILSDMEALTEDYIKESDEGIYENLTSLEEFKSAKSIFFYYSVGREPDTIKAAALALSMGKTVAFAVSYAKGIMHAHVVKSLDEIVVGRFNIPAPPEDSLRLEPDELDLVVVPAVTFNSNGYRLGRGGGYYDRYLPLTKAYTIGLGREKLISDDLPTEEHDCCVNCLVTEKRAARLH